MVTKLLYATLAFCFFLYTSACTAYRRGITGVPASSSKDEYLVHSDEIFAKPDGHALKADIFVPVNGKPKNGFAWVVLIHGGGWEKGNKEQMTPIAERLAKSGFGVMNISYRLSGIKKWPGAIEDCRSAVRWMRKNSEKYNFDPKRVASFGYSAGGHLALLLGNMPNQDLGGEPLRAVIDGAGPVNFSDFPDSDYVKKFMGVPYKGNEKLYAEASPLTYIGKHSPPTYVYYGGNDWIVEPAQNEKLIKKLTDNGIPVESHKSIFGHVAIFLWDEEDSERAIAFLKKHI